HQPALITGENFLVKACIFPSRTMNFVAAGEPLGTRGAYEMSAEHASSFIGWSSVAKSTGAAGALTLRKTRPIFRTNFLGVSSVISVCSLTRSSQPSGSSRSAFAPAPVLSVSGHSIWSPAFTGAKFSAAPIFASRVPCRIVTFAPAAGSALRSRAASSAIMENLLGTSNHTTSTHPWLYTAARGDGARDRCDGIRRLPCRGRAPRKRLAGAGDRSEPQQPAVARGQADRADRRRR